jgi:membrane fusion protein (multidrug efflux system)
MKMPMRARYAAGGLIAVALLGGGWAFAHAEGDAASQTTDDAYVQADFSTVAPKISGLIDHVLVEDNQQVRKGQLLAMIDDRDFRVAVASAEADVRAAEANTRAIQGNIARQRSVIGQSAAAVDAAEAAVSLSHANARRYASLAEDGSASLQEQQETASRLRADEAVRRRDAAAHLASRAQVPILEADLANAQAAVAKAHAALDAARLHLSYTQIRAPIDGTVGRRTLRVGNFVQVGAPLLAIVPLRQAYVEARFRETQLERIHPGQAAVVRFDTMPGVKLKGHVESIAPATGVSFADVAPENATGNFTKIAQRLAVRIVFDGEQSQTRRLRVGMSAVPTIITSQGNMR